MNKTVTINLSGQVFQIDEDAYELLKGYLDSIHARFRNSEGAEEILADIEGRLAEMFQANLSPRKNVVSIQDVEAVMQTMGRPEDFGDVDEEAETTAGSARNSATAGQATSNTTSTANEKIHRKLFRDEDNKVVGGVLSGLSAYVGLHDPIWLRLIFVLFCFISFGTFLIIYFVMWFIVPKAVTASDKLQMKGEPINIDNIERTIKEDLEDFKKNLNNIETKPGYQKARSGLSKVVAAFLELLAILLKFLKGILGLSLIITGLAVLGFCAWNIAIPSEFFSPNPSLLKYFFNSQPQVVLAAIGFGLVILIPFVALVVWGFRILLNQRYRGRAANFSFTGLWILGIILAIVSVVQIKGDFTYEKEVKEQLPIAMPANKVLHLAMLKDDRYNDPYYPFPGSGDVLVEKDAVYTKGNINFTIVKSTNGEFSIEKTMTANGSNRDDAIAKARHIVYNIKQADSVIYFQDYLSFPTQDKLRCQEIHIVLRMPEGTSVFLEKDIRPILNDIKNTKNIYDGEMPNHLWTMTSEGLECVACNDLQQGKGDWDVVTENFSKVEINGAFEVNFKKGTRYGYAIMASSNELKNVEAKVNGGVLEIHSNSHWNLLSSHKITVEVTAPTLDKIVGNGATHIHVAGLEAKDFDLELNGASHGDLSGVKVEHLELNVSGASHAKIAGTATELKAEVDGASHLDGFDLQVVTATVSASGASHADVNVTTKLDADASGASHINYKGSPSISSNSSGFSSIKAEH